MTIAYPSTISKRHPCSFLVFSLIYRNLFLHPRIHAKPLDNIHFKNLLLLLLLTCTPTGLKLIKCAILVPKHTTNTNYSIAYILQLLHTKNMLYNLGCTHARSHSQIHILETSKIITYNISNH